MRPTGSVGVMMLVEVMMIINRLFIEFCPLLHKLKSIPVRFFLF